MTKVIRSTTFVILLFLASNKKDNSHTPSRLFAWLFLSTGVFALAGALFTWGSGWLFYQKDLTISLIPPLFGFGISFGFLIWVIKHRRIS